MTSERALHLELWGKADPARASFGPAWHPLAGHMIDVAVCAERLLREVRPRRWATMAQALGLAPDDALRWLLFWVALHDLGKATPAFQRKVPDAMSRLTRCGFDFPDSDEPHGEMGAALLPIELERLGVPVALASSVARAVAAHHGAFAELASLYTLTARRHTGKRSAWETARAALVSDLAEVFGIHDSLSRPSSPSTAVRSALTADLAGLTATADWLGSDADRFVYREIPSSLAEYMRERAPLAEAGVSAAGFRRVERRHRKSFAELFGRPPWPLHVAVESILDAAPNERLRGGMIIVEAPMGEGKTEAALLLHHALTETGGDGLYFALPTQATANQILGRLEAYLEGQATGAVGLHLVHGGAALSDDYERLRVRGTPGSIGGANTDARVRAENVLADAWFTRSKRALLAPHGVGTVDQALLGVLRAKHHFLRLHGLAGKVVVVDEVHAYDTFTSQILARLCEWLRELGATVVLLSATLSSVQRERLLGTQGVTVPPLAAYPRVLVASRGEVSCVPFAARRPAFAVEVRWAERTAIKAALARDLAAEGGCVAWIVNTVHQAQQLYASFRADPAFAGVEIGLLHARLPMGERLARERAALTAFGPPGPSRRRPRAAVLVGTQVLEQSLDFDFDRLITQVAPLDLMLQRAGRLHRHERSARPSAMHARELWIEEPPHGDDGPDFGPSSHVYEEAVLLRSHAALRGRSSVVLPVDIEPLVELVYGDQLPDGLDPSASPRLAAAMRDARERVYGETADADQRELPAPTEHEPFASFACRYDEEDPAVHQRNRAITRLGDPSLVLVPVTATNGGYTLFGTNVTFGAGALPPPVVKTIARAAIAVSRPALVRGLADASCPAFEGSSFLRHHRLLVLDAAARTRVGSVDVRLDRELGLVLGDLDP